MQTSISKKLLAGLLSVVMVLSLFAAVPASNAQAASVSVSGYSKIASGYTYSYKIQNLSSKQYAKVSVSGEATKGTALGETGKSSVKLTRRDGSTVKSTTKINGLSSGLSPVVRVKASYAWGKTFTLTVKVYNKSTNKLVKTVTKTIRVHRKTKDIQLNRDVVALKVGEDVTVAAATVPAEYTLPIKWSSDNTSVATVNKGVVTAVAEGTANIKATSGNKTATVTVNVVKYEDGLDATLTNPFSATYPNTVLVNTNAVIRVKYTKNGKPVSGETVVLNITHQEDGGLANPYVYKGMNACVTDNQGFATFVIGNSAANVKAYHDDEVASVSYTATLASTGAEVKGQVDFAAINLTNVRNVNNHNLIAADNLVPGTNAVAVGTEELVETLEMTLSAHNEYVASQQVSVEGTSTHEVIFKGGYPVITLPGTATDTTAAKKKVDEINFKSDEYHTYTNAGAYPTDYKIFSLSEDVNKLTYATVNFSNVKISKYTELVVETWKDENVAKNRPDLTTYRVDQKVYKGSMDGENFNYQVPLRSGASGTWCVKVYLRSAGQVDTAMNDGYTLKDITYVFNTSTGTAGDVIPVQNASVNWSVVETPYTAEVELTAAQITALNDAIDANIPAGNDLGDGLNKSYYVDWYKVNGVDTQLPAGSKVTYKVPAFPYTGTAIITQYDKNGKVVGYFAIATVNDAVIAERAVAAGTYATFNAACAALGTKVNTNVIDFTASAYAISADELRDKVGSITSQDGTQVVVNSTVTGRTTLEGTVTIDGKTVDGFDAETDSVYASVQWNPVPVAETAKESKAFVALLGQKIELYAQLTDVNGNAVKTAGQNVTFYKTGTPDVAVAAPVVAPATIVTQDTVTDSNGQAKLVLKAAEFTQLAGLYAKSNSNNYKVVLKIAGTTVELADLYWVDCDLAFTDEPGGTTYATSATTPNLIVKDTAGGNKIMAPNAGETWEYGVYTKSLQPLTVGCLAGDSLIVNDMTINTTKGSNSVGSFTALSNGKVTATSTKAGELNIVNKIDANSVNDKVTISAVYGTPVVYAGVGATTINKKLTLDVQWQAQGVTAAFANVAPQYAASQTRNVFLKVTDANGNPLTGQTVNFTADNGSTLSVGPYTTDAFGVESVTVTRTGTETTTTVTATVDGLTGETFTTTIYWVDGVVANAFVADNTADPVTGDYKVIYDKNAGTITIPMTQDVYAPSVHKKQFTVVYQTKAEADGGAVGTTLAVSSVDVNGNVITLHVPTMDKVDAAGKITVTYANAPNVAGVDYVLTSEEGVALTTATTLVFKPDDGNTAPSTIFASAAFVDNTLAVAANAAIVNANTAYTTLAGAKNAANWADWIAKETLADNAIAAYHGDVNALTNYTTYTANKTAALALITADKTAVDGMTLTATHANGAALKTAIATTTATNASVKEIMPTAKTATSVTVTVTYYDGRTSVLTFTGMTATTDITVGTAL